MEKRFDEITRWLTRTKFSHNFREPEILLPRLFCEDDLPNVRVRRNGWSSGSICPEGQRDIQRRWGSCGTAWDNVALSFPITAIKEALTAAHGGLFAAVGHSLAAKIFRSHLNTLQIPNLKLGCLEF